MTKPSMTLTVDTRVSPSSGGDAVTAIVTPDHFDPSSLGEAVNQLPSPTPSEFFEGIEYIFSCSDGIFQGKWLNVDVIVAALNTLSVKPLSPAVHRCFYDCKNFKRALTTGLGEESLLGDSGDFDCETTKNYFFVTHESRKGPIRFVFVDTDIGFKTVPVPAPANLDWVACVGSQPLPKVLYFPPELYALINYWYSPEAKTKFAARADETTLEAVNAQADMLQEAATSDVKMKELIDGLGKEDAPCDFNGDPVQLSPDQIATLVASTRPLALFIARALKLAAAVDGEKETLDWKKVCAQAVVDLNSVGHSCTSKTGHFIAAWYNLFREHRRFPNPLLDNMDKTTI